MNFYFSTSNFSFHCETVTHNVFCECLKRSTEWPDYYANDKVLHVNFVLLENEFVQVVPMK